ncbi:MAG: GNAT family N-acetyltransferase [Bacteroidota bacterium]
MEIQHYGIRLKTIGLADLERMRQWRNAEHVRPNMEYQAEITPAMQRAWFAKLDPERNLYFTFGSGTAGIGVVHLKDLDWTARCGEAGVFVGLSEWLNTHLPVVAVLTMMDFAFSALRLTKLQAKVRADNPAVLTFNRQLGYRPLPDQADLPFVRLEVDASAYADRTAKLRAALTRRHPTPMSIRGASPFWAERLRK